MTVMGLALGGVPIHQRCGYQVISCARNLHCMYCHRDVQKFEVDWWWRSG